MTYETPSDDIKLDDMFDVLQEMGFSESRAQLIVAEVLEGVAASMRLAAGMGSVFAFEEDDQQERLKRAIIGAIKHLPESELANLKDLPS